LLTFSWGKLRLTARAIEQITSSTKTVFGEDENGKPCHMQVKVWNPTIANLTLMALGSSAPEILLSVIETVTTLGSTPGELGPSTIVGSAAFNLLVISGVSIAAVDEPKKIYDLGVFWVTTISSIFAYVWLLIVLKFWTPNYVSLTEAVLTMIFFFLLVICAFTADKINERIQRKNESARSAAQRKQKQIKLVARDKILKLVENGYKKAYLVELVYGTKGVKADPKYETIL
jgi:solute carrier family 8 (sodium/calcium exchanger)